jgi:Ca2+/Na+ antiporter
MAYAGVLLIALGAHLGVALIQIGFVVLLAGFMRPKAWKSSDKPLAVALLAFAAAALFHNVIGTLGFSNWGYALHWRYAFILLVVPVLLSAQQRRSSLDALLLLSGISGLISNVPAFAYSCALVLLWPAAEWLIGRKRLPGWKLAACLFSLLGIVVSGSRGAWLGLGAGLLMLTIIRFLPRWRSQLALAGLGAIVLAGTAAVFVVSPATKTGGLAGRNAIWAQCKETLVETFPRGLGYGNHPKRAEVIPPKTVPLKPTMKTWCYNLPLSLAVEAPATLLALAWLLLLLIRRCAMESERTALACAAILGFAAVGMVHDPHFQREFFPLAMLLIALGIEPPKAFVSRPRSL